MLYYCSPSFDPHVLYIVISAVGRCEKPAAATTPLVNAGARLRVQLGVKNVHVGDERLAAHEGAIEIRMAKNRARKARLGRKPRLQPPGQKRSSEIENCRLKRGRRKRVAETLFPFSH